MTIGTRQFFAERKRIVELAGKYRLPAIYFQKDFVDEGGLMSYGVNFDDLFRRSAVYVDKILKGARPGRPCRCSRRRSLSSSSALRRLKDWSDNSEPRARAGESSDQVRREGVSSVADRADDRKDMKKKITVLTLCAMLFTLCSIAESQQPTKVPRIACLSAGSFPKIRPPRGFRQRLRELGYVEGKNLAIEYRARRRTSVSPACARGRARAA